MTAAQLLVVGLASLAAALIGALLLWLDERYFPVDEDTAEMFDDFTHGRLRP